MRCSPVGCLGAPGAPLGPAWAQGGYVTSGLSTLGTPSPSSALVFSRRAGARRFQETASLLIIERDCPWTCMALLACVAGFRTRTLRR